MSDKEDKNATKEVEDLIIDVEKDKKKKKKDKKEKKEKKEKEEDNPEDDEEKKEKKKKKKDKKDKKEKKKDEEEEPLPEEVKESTAPEQSEPEVEVIDFSAALHLKKRVTKECKLDRAAASAKPTKQKKKREAVEQKVRINLNAVEGHEAYTYESMIKRIQEIIKEKTGSDGSTTTAFKLLDVQVSRGRTKSTWINFNAQVEAIARDPQHILAYFLSELGCVGNIGSEGEMILVGGYKPPHFMRLMRRYTEEFVQCKVCKGYKTTIEKEEKTRLTFLRCKTCQASRTVSGIQAHFQATKRGERRRARQ